MAQSTWASVVARVKAQIETVANIGLVHDRLRLAVEEADVAAVMYATIDGEKRLRSWYVHLGTMPAEALESSGSMKWNRVVQVEGFLQFEDAAGSEKTALALAESVIRTLWNDLRTTKLNGTVLAGKPPQIVDAQPRSFGGVVVSYVRLEMPVVSIETP